MPGTAEHEWQKEHILRLTRLGNPHASHASIHDGMLDADARHNLYIWIKNWWIHILVLAAMRLICVEWPVCVRKAYIASSNSAEQENVACLTLATANCCDI